MCNENISLHCTDEEKEQEKIYGSTLMGCNHTIYIIIYHYFIEAPIRFNFFARKSVLEGTAAMKRLDFLPARLL